MSLTRLSLLFVVIVKCSSVDLPDYFPRCNLEDPNLDNCILKSANELRSQISKGVDIIGVPDFNPLNISDYKLFQETPLASFTAILSNFTLAGFEKYDFKELGHDPFRKRFYGKVRLDSIAFDTGLNIDGKVLFIPLTGVGRAVASFGPITGVFEVKGNLEDIDGVEYYKPKETKVKLVMEDGTYLVSGLFNGNELINRLTNVLLNENSKAIANAVTPAFERMAEEGLTWLMESIMKNLPYYKMFPRSE